MIQLAANTPSASAPHRPQGVILAEPRQSDRFDQKPPENNATSHSNTNERAQDHELCMQLIGRTPSQSISGYIREPPLPRFSKS